MDYIGSIERMERKTEQPTTTSLWGKPESASSGDDQSLLPSPGMGLGIVTQVIESGSGSKPMTWNEFQRANAGKYTKSQMSEAWDAYKRANYLNEGEHYLQRPYIRQSTIDAVNANTRTNSRGQIYDSIGRKWVDADNVDLGHVPSHEFWYERRMAETHGMTRVEFNNYMNNPDFYAWQDRHDNRSHALEDRHE